ncbi:hypothetical protein [Nonomuraea sp. 10N515B]|uniref:hypothetical protein n=1 Tax=Nonomuraea sp. 10N515B TaxID=3457422 RepID=UPI003FCE6BBE
MVGTALTGSHAVGDGDRWSDIDLVLAVRGDIAAVLDPWTARLYDEFGALHHWDLSTGTGIIRVFLSAPPATQPAR